MDVWVNLYERITTIAWKWGAGGEEITVVLEVLLGFTRREEVGQWGWRWVVHGWRLAC
jgi:hypothetical protein